MPPLRDSPTGVKTQYGSFLQYAVCTFGKSFASINFHVLKMSTSCAQNRAYVVEGQSQIEQQKDSRRH
jgi:hypothetical protein